MFIIWKDDATGFDLKPAWEVELARVHTTGLGELALYVKTTKEQLDELVRFFGRESLPEIGVLGLAVIPLRAGEPVWTWKPPRGYERSIKPGTYHGFEIVAELPPGRD